MSATAPEEAKPRRGWLRPAAGDGVAPCCPAVELLHAGQGVHEQLPSVGLGHPADGTQCGRRVERAVTRTTSAKPVAWRPPCRASQGSAKMSSPPRLVADAAALWKTAKPLPSTPVRARRSTTTLRFPWLSIRSSSTCLSRAQPEVSSVPWTVTTTTPRTRRMVIEKPEGDVVGVTPAWDGARWPTAGTWGDTEGWLIRPESRPGRAASRPRSRMLQRAPPSPASLPGVQRANAVRGCDAGAPRSRPR